MANVIGTLKFNLDEVDSAQRHARTIRCDEAYALLWDIDQMLRSKLKYETISESEASVYDAIRTKIADTGLLDLYE